MENDEIAPAQKKQVSEKVMQNLAKAQARRKELHEQNKATRSAEKEVLKKQKKIDKLKKQLVQLLPSTNDSESEPEPEVSSQPTVEVEMPQETVVSVKKIKAPPPVEKAPTTHYAPPKPVKERVKPAPPPPPKPNVQYF